MSYSGKFKDKNNNLHPVTSVLYGTCDTAAATAAKVVTCSDFDALMTGVTIRVKFANANTAESPTVNINSTGAKSVYRFGSTAPVDGSSWNAGEVVELVYDGTSFFMTGADDIAAKQNATDDSLETTDKTIVGAINEHEGDIGTLKSGLTNLDNEVNGDATVYPYADVITIPDAIPANLADCNVKIEPVQDLHGYDKPWVGGAGDNKLDTSTVTVGNVTFTEDTDGYVSCADGDGRSWSYANCQYKLTLPSGSYKFVVDTKTVGSTGKGCVFKDSSGNDVLSINSANLFAEVGVVAYDFTLSAETSFGAEIKHGGAVARFMIVSSTVTNTWQPYTNYCPITGHTEAVVARNAVNQWDEQWESGVYDAEGNPKSDSLYIRSKNYINVAPDTDYYWKCDCNSSYFSICYYDANKVFIKRDYGYNRNRVYRTPVNARYVRFNMTGQYGTSYRNDISINYPSTNTDFVPYAGKTYTIALGDTIYGGTVDFDSGVMTVTHGFAEFDGSVDENWTYEYHVSADNFYISLQDANPTSSSDEIISNMFTASYSTMWVSGAHNLNVKPNIGISNVNDWKAWLSSNHLHVCYELATPTTVQLTPQQIQLLKGTNTITASTGQISVTANGVSGSIGQVQEKVNDHEERIEDLESGLDTVKSGLTNVSSTIEELQAYTGYSSTDIIGIEVDYVNKSFRRLGAAVDKNGGTDFDAFPMFGGRRRCNVADDGTISQYYGDTGYAEDGSNGQVMVYQPKFYYKVVPLKLEKQSTGKGYHIRKAAYYVTATPMKGFKVHPAFVNASGNEVDYILVGASKGCIYDVSESAYILDDAQVMDNTADKFSSIFGVKPASGLTQDLTRVKIEQMCQNRGANWHELNVQMASMTQLLMLIEYGKFDMQRAIGKGVVDIADNSSYNCGATSGSTSALGNASGRATSTTIVTNTSTTYTYDGKTSVTYRGEEDPYGDMWEFVIGMNIYGNGSMNGGEPYICSDYNYAESKNTDNYKGAGFTVANSDGYVNAWGYGSEDFDWLFIASEVGGSDALPVGDYLWKTANLNGYRIALLGADWVDAWTAGGFGWALNVAVGTGNRYVAGRLAYIPA